jgi:hypothetical protein
MTREELKAHCERQIQQFERIEKIMPVTPNDWKRYEEHKLILELLEQETVSKLQRRINMADIELVIKLPEKAYKHIMSMQFCIPGLRSGKSLLEEILKAIRTGTPLPKGHGRLIDADAIEYWKNDRPDEIGYHFAPKYIIDDAPTIIETDTESRC